MVCLPQRPPNAATSTPRGHSGLWGQTTQISGAGAAPEVDAIVAAAARAQAALVDLVRELAKRSARRRFAAEQLRLRVVRGADALG